MHFMTRKITNRLYELVDDGFLDWETIGKSALCYLSEDDVADMAQQNQLLPGDDDD